MKALVFGVLVSLGSVVYAGPYNSAQVAVAEIKVWPDYIDVYIEDDHECSFSDKHRYVLNKEEKEMFAAALSAMQYGMRASVNYSCDTVGRPVIEGIRVKP